MLSCLYLESARTVFCLTFAHYALIDRRRLLCGPLREAALSVVPRRSVCHFCVGIMSRAFDLLEIRKP